MTPHSVPEDVLDRWLAGKATADDHRHVDQWIAADPARAAELHAVRAATRDSFPWAPVSSVHIAAVKASARADVQSRPARVTSRDSNGRSVLLRAVIASVAASALVVVGLIATRSVARRTALWGHAEVSHAPRVYRTGPAQQAAITLADGSHVRLAPMSTLTVLTDLADSRTADRVVTLSGEALFNVTPSSRTAFVVRTRSMSARVLGTTFDVNAYASNSHARVAVVSGKVMVDVHGVPTIVTAGTMAHVADSTITTTNVVDMTAYTAWTDGVLVFRKAPVSELLQTLGQWYGLQLVAHDSSITTGHITVTFDHKTQSEMLHVLADLLHVSLTFAPDGQGATVVTLHAQRASSHTSRRDATLEGDWTREVGR